MASGRTSQPRTAEVIFEDDFLPTRMWATVARAAVFQITTLFIFSLARSLLLLQPFSAEGEGFPIGWLVASLSAIIQPSSWIYDGITFGCFALLGLLYTNNFQTSAKVPQGSGGGSFKGIIASAFAAITSNGILNALASLSAHLLISSCLLRCYVGLLGPSRFSSLTMICDLEYGTDRCLNQSHVFLVISGAYTGLCVWWRFHGPSNGNVLRFPLVQLSGNTTIRQLISVMIKDSATQVALGLRWFYILYLLLGQRLESAIADVLQVDSKTYYEKEDSTGSLLLLFSSSKISNSIWSIVCLLFHCWTLNAVLNFNISLLQTIFSINMTKRIRFPITARQTTTTAASSAPNAPSSIMLMDAMKSGGASTSSSNQSALLLKHLAFQDFADLAAAQSKFRRSEFFTLSQPGGHPHYWNDVRSRCLNVVEEFSQDLEKASKPAPPTAATPVVSSQTSTVTQATTATPTLMRLRRLGGPQTPVNSVGKSVGFASSDIQCFIPTGTGSVPLQTRGNNQHTNGDGTLLSKLGAYLVGPEKIAAAISAASAFSFSGGGSGGILGDSAIRSVYAKSQLVIWAVDGLSHLVAASISEDRYGVVQKDLPKVLEALLTLQQTVERHRKGSTATARKNRFETQDLQLKQELRVALKSSLFRICVAFGEHLEALPLAPELRQRLHSYQTFAEA